MEKVTNFIPKFEKNKLFVIDYKVLALVGFTPENMANLRLLIIVTLNLLLEVLPEFYFIVHNFDDVQAVFMCLHEFVSLLVFVLKVFVMFSNRHKMVSLVTDLKNEWNYCECTTFTCQGYPGNELLPTITFRQLTAFTEANADWRQVGIDLEKLIFTTTRNFYVFIFASGCVYFTAPIIIYFLFFVGHDIDNPHQWPLPVQVYYGFEFPDHPLLYVLFIIITIPHMLLVTLAFYGSDIFFINILIFCTSYMKYVQSEIEQLKGDLGSSLVEDDEAIRKRVSRIVRLHNVGIELAEKLECVLNLLMLVLYSVSTMVLCFLFFEFHILLSDFVNFLKVLIFFAVVQTLLVLYSYFGTKLMDESQSVGDAVYDLPWYNINDCQTRKFLLLAIVRSQKPMTISSGKFYSVNLESYYNALSTAYSCCTVLLKVM